MSPFDFKYLCYRSQLSTSNPTSWVLDTRCGAHICGNVQGLRSSTTWLKVSGSKSQNEARVVALVVGTYDLTLLFRRVLELNSCYFVPTMNRNIISISCLNLEGFMFVIENNNLSIFRGDNFYCTGYLMNGFYILNIESSDYKSIYNINTKKFKSNDLNPTQFLQCRLGHINEKHISRLNENEVLDSFDFKSFELCESCLLEKMTKNPFSRKGEKATELLSLI